MSQRPRSTTHPPARVPTRATIERREKRRRRLARRLAWAAVASVVLAVGALIGVKAAGGGGDGSPARSPLSHPAASRITGVPVQVLLDAAAQVHGLEPALPVSGAPLSADGKPEVLYIGAEFCPVCAAERWPLLVALSQFGTFSGLSETHSAVRDGKIPTISFYGSSYASPYLTFTPVETTTNQPAGNYYRKLETPSAAQMATWRSIQGENLTFPFVDLGGRWALETSQYPVRVLQGRSFDDTLATIGRNDTTSGSAINASAAALVKYLCSLTGQQPASTCSAVANVQIGGTGGSGASSPAG